MSAHFGPQDFRAATNVSRETLARLEAFAALLATWRKRIGLIGAGDVDSLWSRHMLDSAQLAPLAPEKALRWADLGSGAGFPGIVLAVLLAARPGFGMSLVESNVRKASFLREAVRITGAPACVFNARIEELAPLSADVITARAIAPLPQLLEFYERHRAPGGLALFLKGKDVDRELTAARGAWSLEVELLPSLTDPGGKILRIHSASRRTDGHSPG